MKTYDQLCEHVADTVDLQKIRLSSMSGGTWVSGTAAGHRFEALVFAEHAENPDYEIGRSRISKLWIQRLSDRVTTYNWDRGIDVYAADAITRAIVDFLAAGLAETVFDE